MGDYISPIYHLLREPETAIDITTPYYSNCLTIFCGSNATFVQKTQLLWFCLSQKTRILCMVLWDSEGSSGKQQRQAWWNFKQKLSHLKPCQWPLEAFVVALIQDGFPWDGTGDSGSRRRIKMVDNWFYYPLKFDAWIRFIIRTLVLDIIANILRIYSLSVSTFHPPFGDFETGFEAAIWASLLDDISIAFLQVTKGWGCGPSVDDLQKQRLLQSKTTKRWDWHEKGMIIDWPHPIVWPTCSIDDVHVDKTIIPTIKQ